MLTDEQIREVIAEVRALIPVPMSADPVEAGIAIYKMMADMQMSAFVVTGGDREQMHRFLSAGLAMLLTDFKAAVLAEVGK